MRWWKQRLWNHKMGVVVLFNPCTMNKPFHNDWSILKSAWPLFDHILALPPPQLGVRNNHTCVRIWELKDRWSCQLKHFHQHFGVTDIFYPAYSRSYSYRSSTLWWWFPKIRLHFTCMQSPLAVPKKDANAAEYTIVYLYLMIPVTLQRIQESAWNIFTYFHLSSPPFPPTAQHNSGVAVWVPKKWGERRGDLTRGILKDLRVP